MDGVCTKLLTVTKGQQPPYGQQAPYGQQPQYSAQPQYGQQQGGDVAYPGYGSVESHEEAKGGNKLLIFLVCVAIAVVVALILAFVLTR